MLLALTQLGIDPMNMCRCDEAFKSENVRNRERGGVLLVPDTFSAHRRSGLVSLKTADSEGKHVNLLDFS